MMPTESFSAKLAQRLALDLAWSLWTEFGVSGQRRNHSQVGADLEPLIVATAYLSRFDARLRDESLDWCVMNARYVSSDRLRNFIKTVDDEVARAFGRFSATMKSHRRVSWPGSGDALESSSTGRSVEPDLFRPALLQLRLRAVFGVTGRAEVLRWLLDRPDRFAGSLEIAVKSYYGKDNVADALELLSSAGLVEANVQTTAGNQRVFRLDPISLVAAALIGWATVPQQRWDAVFRIVTRLVEFAGSAPDKPAPRAVAIHALVADLQSDLRWLGTFPRLRQGVEAVNEDFDIWAMEALTRWSGAA